MRQRFTWLVVVMCAACASIYGGEDDDESPPPRNQDAGTDAEPDTSVAQEDASDASVPVEASTTCSPTAPFTDIAPIAEVNTPDSDDFAHLSTDEKTMYLSRGSATAVYTRASIADAWSGGAGIDINAGNQGNVRVTDDTLRAYFNAYLGGSITATRLIKKSRPTTTDAFGGTVAFDFALDAGINDTEPFLLPDEKTVYYASNRDGNYDIWVAHKNASNGWNNPPPTKSALSSATANDRSPVVSDDELVIYFSSDRPGASRIWVARRAGADAGFDVTTVSELAGGTTTRPTYLSKDLCRLYFVSDRTGGKGGNDIWRAARKP